MEASEIKRDWATRGFSYTLWEDPPGQVWQDFVHETDELVILLSGAIELSFQGQTVRPQIGAEVCIPARARHTVRNIGSTPNRWCFGYRQTA